jgi:PIN domain nuclease of toxin-antitoxin system
MEQLSPRGCLAVIAGIADTHTIIWYLFGDSRLSKTAHTFIDTAAGQGVQIGISSITLVETVYLIEKGRIPAETFSRLTQALQAQPTLQAEAQLDLAVARALSRVDSGQIPDMPDRIIAATALYLGVPVISRDSRIRLSSLQTIW